MKKSNWLIAILLVICSVISTNATAQSKGETKRENKVVILDSVPANKVINDLVSGDAAKAMNKVLKSQIKIKTLAIQGQTSQIHDLKKQLSFMKLAATENDTIKAKLNKEIVNDKQVIKKEKNKKTFWQVLSITLAVFAGYLAAK